MYVYPVSNNIEILSFLSFYIITRGPQVGKIKYDHLLWQTARIGNKFECLHLLVHYQSYMNVWWKSDNMTESLPAWL